MTMIVNFSLNGLTPILQEQGFKSPIMQKHPNYLYFKQACSLQYQMIIQITIIQLRQQFSQI